VAASRTAVIVLNWNGAGDTERCLENLLRLAADDFSIFVCDNASSDDSVARLRAWQRDRLPVLNAMRATDIAMRLIETGGNLGYAGGNNVGLRAALAEGFSSFWILNNDCEPEPDSLCWLRRRLVEDPAIGLCGSTLVYAHDRRRVQALGGGSFSRLKGRGSAIGGLSDARLSVDQASVERRLRFVNGASMLVTRAFIETVGLMSEDYFLYWEELDWAARSGGRFRLGYAPQSIVRHKVGASIGTSDFGWGSALSVYYLTRNRVRFCWRHSRWSLPFVYADIARQVARQCVTGNWPRARLLARAMAGFPFASATGGIA